MLRFIDERGKIKEKLVAFKAANDSSGRSRLDLFCSICFKYGLDWQVNLKV